MDDKVHGIDRCIRIAGLFDNREWQGECTAGDRAAIVGCTQLQAGCSLKALDFKKVSQQKHSKGKKVPAHWSPPVDWPELFAKQRRLRKQGMSPVASADGEDDKG